jgi:protein translocase SecG subunit
MSFIAGILTVLLVLNCLVLILLVLVQLPKKGRGRGHCRSAAARRTRCSARVRETSLTKITKWGTGVFFGMALILGLVNKSAQSSDAPAFEQAVQQKQQSQMPVAVPPSTPIPSAPTTASNSSALPVIPAGGPPATPQTN